MVSDNITKLRVLVNELCEKDNNQKIIEEYKKILFKIKQIIDVENDKVINVSVDDDNRLKSYEKMCSKIQIILNKIKIA